MILPYKNKRPMIAADTFIAPNATVVGDVEISAGASVWYGSVLRGDLAPIRIGTHTNIQDNCTIHTDVNKPTIIGDHVTIGHNAVVHGCVVEKSCLIGMNAVILSGAHLKTGTVIAAGAVVKEGQTAGPYELLAGMPATLKKKMEMGILELLDLSVEGYLELAKEHLETLSKCNPPLR